MFGGLQMRVFKLRTNHIENPMGFELGKVRFSWITEDTNSQFQTAAQVQVSLDEKFENTILDTKKREDIDSLAFVPDLELKPRTRYFWRVTVWGDAGDQSTSEVVWFETAKMEEPWTGKWITPTLDKDIHPLIRKSFTLPEGIVSARAYISGVGIYDIEINGNRVGDEYLAPGYNAYDFWLQYQTYDVTDLLKSGHNSVGIKLGNGWYKGRFGFDGGYTELYGSEFAVIGEIVVTLDDGREVLIATNQDWKCSSSPITFSNIYDGEVYDANLEQKNWTLPEYDDTSWSSVTLTKVSTEKFQARLSLPVKIMEERKPIEVIHTPAGETVLDFGQVMTGWVRFKTYAAKGKELKLQYGEILQNENFYRENLRTAKAEYVYISDGSEREVQPHFTYYGFRYVNLIGFEENLHADDFTGCVLYSELEETGSVETSNPLVNQLFQNALWGQKGNFLDVPTDCPQRDERMGWTGDAQVFVTTANYNMYSPAFYQKFMFDLREEQKRLEGSVPFTVPRVKPKGGQGFIDGHGSSAWGDAATIIPWTLYQMYGDKELLRSQFDSMKDWVDYIKKIDDQSGGKRLWKEGFHFGDWLALDGQDPQSPMGGTDSHYIASAYYCYSAELVAKAAKVLGKQELAGQYQNLANEVRISILNEYFTPNGRSAINTQTAMIVALYMNLVPDNFRDRIITDLHGKLRQDNMHLTTGFVGTPYFCNVLSENDANKDAYTLLLNDDYPSWLYAVKLGATTIWERWNSVLPDGSISGSGMNSLNHYAYGSIVDWMYRYMCGINSVEEAPGFKRIKLAPKPYGSLKSAKAAFNSASGFIESSWKINEDGSLTLKFSVPFNTRSEVILPDAEVSAVKVNGKPIIESGRSVCQQRNNVVCEITSGLYVFEYVPSRDYILKYSCENKLRELLDNNATKAILTEALPELINSEIINMVLNEPLKDVLVHPFAPKRLSSKEMDELNKALGEILL